MLVILPFEKEFYKKWNYEVEYVGHPLVEVIDEFIREQIPGTEYPIQRIKQSSHLLPGSRKQEILKKLPDHAGGCKTFSRHTNSSLAKPRAWMKDFTMNY